MFPCWAISWYLQIPEDEPDAGGGLGIGELVPEGEEVGAEDTALVAPGNTESGVGITVWLTLGSGIDEYESTKMSS